MKAIVSLAYGLAAYGLFLVTILYTVGFVGNLGVPKAIDSGVPGPLAEAALVDLALIAAFGVQHSVMARQSFKRWWTRFVPARVERSTYVVCSSLVLILLLWQWQPMPATVWQVQNAAAVKALRVLSWTGWSILFMSSYLIDHFELFGLRQAIARPSEARVGHPVLRTPFFYRYVRHPLYLGFIVAFWSTPSMSAGHLLFAVAMTGYILVGIHFEERDLTRTFGEQYSRYQDRVGMLLPRPSASASREAPTERSPSSVA